MTLSMLPKAKHQETKGYEGFFHVNHLTGSIEETMELIIRDHSKQKFEKRKNLRENHQKK
jgi:tripeptide aminopeptidase